MLKLTKKHIIAVEKLIERYQTITIEEITDAMSKTVSLREIKTKLTGFNDMSKCILCKSIKPYKPILICNKCIHRLAGLTYSYPCISNKTYSHITLADTPIGLLTAYKERAVYLQSLLDQYNKECKGR